MKNNIALYQFVDSAFPTGSFSHSFGLETAFKENRISGPSDLFEWTRSYISGSLAPTEGIAVYIAYQAVRNESLEIQEWTKDTEKLLQRLDKKLTLSKMASESRKGTVKVGKRYLKIVEALYPESGLHQYMNWIDRQFCYGNPAIVHGWIAAYLGVTADSAIFTHLYASINNLLQSAVRMTVVGQKDVQMILKELYSIIQEETEVIIDNSPTEEDLFNYSIIQEMQAMRHETLYSRLFMS